MTDKHPGGEELTIFLLEMAGLTPCRILDMGAGEGKTVRYLKSIGFEALGIDKNPGADVEEGDFLHTLHQDGSFDAVISECAFYASGDAAGAAKEAARLLKQGGKLLLSDVCFGTVNEHITMLEGADFSVLHVEDATPLWREYYLERIWDGTAQELCSAEEEKKCRYFLTICERK